MNPEIKQKWLEALRSGDYEQGKSYLHRIDEEGVDRYCCLGVLCNVLGVERELVGPNEEMSRQAHYTYDGRFGLPSANVEVDTGIDSSVCLQLAKLNDEQSASFDEIADYIEREL